MKLLAPCVAIFPEMLTNEIDERFENLAARPTRLGNVRNRLLPPSTRWIRIEGGNHSQFGCTDFSRAIDLRGYRAVSSRPR